MKYWDSSAIVPLFIKQPLGIEVRKISLQDLELSTWWGTHIECASAFERLKKQDLLSDSDLLAAKNSLEKLIKEVDIISPSPWLKERALRLLSLHSLRAGDVLQLASALQWCQEQPKGAGFVCLDDRLRKAALAEGFDVLPHFSSH